MPYTKTTWKEDGSTPITANELNRMETQYEKALGDSVRANGQKMQMGAVAIPNTSATSVTIIFPEPFAEPPLIFINLRSTQGQYKPYYIFAESANGFSIAFDTPFTTTTGVRFGWLAIGN